MLVELYRLVILLTAVGDISQVIACLSTQIFVLCALGEVGENALGLLHGILVVIFLRGDAALTHQRGSEVELGFLAGGIGLQSLAILNLGLGIAFFLIQFVAVAQACALLLGHFGALVLCRCRHGDSQCQKSDQH